MRGDLWLIVGMQKKLTRTSIPVAYFGEVGSFSHLAARRRFPKADLVSCRTEEECFSALIAEKFSHIIVPIENASAGMIINTVDQLILMAENQNAKLAIREALAMPVQLALLASSRTAQVKTIYSHLAPFKHAKAWLKKHYPHATLVTVVSTSEAARRAREEKGTAAIAGLHAADLYQLKVLRDDVGAEVANQTTFFVVGQEVKQSRKPTHTTIVFEAAHKPGTLFRVLQALAKQKLNLTRIESRPIPGRFSEYRFMIEFEGGPQQPVFQRAMKSLKRCTHRCAVLGSYPVIRLNGK